METTKERSKQEYIYRINKVMDYIEKHIDQPLTLNELADVACFSSFHFHRIFTYLTGETPIAFTQRLRIEKAAQLLRNNQALSVSEIAFMCGFSSLSLFSRTFRKTFGVTSREFRKEDRIVLAKNGVYFSKQGKLVSKNGKNNPAIMPELCPVEFKQLFFMETKIEVKQLPDMRVIYCRHTGPFHEIGKAYQKLARWAAPRDLYEEGKTKSMTVTHDDPAVTDISKIRQSACILVDKDVEPEGEFGKMTVSGGKFVVGRFELGVSDFEQAWNTMCDWFTESGYKQAEGSTFELYHNDIKPEKTGAQFVVDICIPVTPL